MQPDVEPGQVGEQHLLVALATTLTAGRRRLEDLLTLMADPNEEVPPCAAPGPGRARTDRSA